MTSDCIVGYGTGLTDFVIHWFNFVIQLFNFVIRPGSVDA
jgi:hypothetical protein